VEVGDVPVHAERRDVDRNLPGACAASASTATPCARSRAAVSRSGKTSALCAVMCSTIASRVRGPTALGVGVGQSIGANGIRHLDGAHGGAALAGGKERRAQHAAVDEIGDQDLVALAQRKRAQDRVGAGGDVVHEHEVRAARAEERGDLVGGRAQPRRLRQRPAELGVRQRAQDEAARVRSISSRIACCTAMMRRGVTPTVP
jgi:hypothetical protein